MCFYSARLYTDVTEFFVKHPRYTVLRASSQSAWTSGSPMVQQSGYDIGTCVAWLGQKARQCQMMQCKCIDTGIEIWVKAFLLTYIELFSHYFVQI